jgi:hypothetical protein
MSEQDQADLRLAAARLSQDHADLDVAINAMEQCGSDPLVIQRMKKKKLAMKDKLSKLKNQLVPDILA